ncbi:MAG: methionyl-tRNA formyltransferase [Hyphomicrobiaceae bacterium]
MGTPEFSVPALSEIIGAGHDVVAVYAQPPRPAGRGMAERKTPVHAHAEACGIEVRTPASLKTAAAAAEFAALNADVAVVIAYGLLLPKPILEAPKHGCLNMHASKLPRWRGAAPIQRAIMAGDTETAVMVMQMEEGLDTGPVCLGDAVTIAKDTTAGELHDQLARQGADIMVRALAALERGSLTQTPQSEDGVTYAHKITKQETRIDFSKAAADVHNHVRGLSPFPGAWFEIEADGRHERIKVLRSELLIGNGASKVAPGTFLDGRMAIACGDGAIRCTHLQRAGKKAMALDDFLRGFDAKAGMVISNTP